MAYWTYREITWKPGMYEQPRQNGKVLEHREVAAKAIGRALRRSECVHHRDEVKSNNDPTNLVVFSTQADHTRFHKGGKLIPNGDGTFRCESLAFNPCPGCGGSRSYGVSLCSGCRKKKNSAHIPSSEELEDLVWRMPTTQVAEMFGVSDSAVTKWCKKYQIKKPPRGYWTGRVT